MLRCHSLPIRNNLYRFKLVDSNTCLECDEAETETHVLFQCKKYTDLRCNHPSLCTLQQPLHEAFVSLINTENTYVIDSVITYLSQALATQLQGKHFLACR